MKKLKRGSNKLKIDLWKGLYLSGLFDYLDAGNEKIKHFADGDKNKEVETYLRNVVEENKRSKKGFKKMYDGYLINLDDDLYMKILMIQQEYLGFVLYKMDVVERYVTDNKTDSLTMTKYKKGNIRGL